MASRKNLKKNVNKIVGELFTECLVLKSIKKIEEEKVDEVLVILLDFQNEFITRLSHVEPGSEKVFYKTYYTDFNHQLDGIIAKIKEL